MAQNQVTITCPAGTWTQLATGVTEISFEALSGPIEIRGTVGATPPDDSDNGWSYPQRTGYLKKPLSDLFYAAGIDTVYARPLNDVTTTVLVDTA